MPTRIRWPKMEDGKPPGVVIIDPPYNAAGTPFLGTHTGRMSSGTPLYDRGDWVLWRQNCVGPARIARVSRVDQDGPWGQHLYHIRLRTPAESALSRRWGYSARVQELQPASAVDLLGRLTA